MKEKLQTGPEIASGRRFTRADALRGAAAVVLFPSGKVQRKLQGLFENQSAKSREQ
jgi:hypothetical protein